MTPHELHDLSAAELWRRVRAGAPVDPDALADAEYEGLTLLVHRLSWPKFKKVFKRRPDGAIVGWNVAVHPTPLDAAWIDRYHGVHRVTYWPFVVTWEGSRTLLDYGPPAPRLAPIRRVRDPLVQLDDTWLLGVSMLRLAGPLSVPTPAFFALRRGGPRSYDLEP